MLPHGWKECRDKLIRGELQHPWLLFEDCYETTISGWLCGRGGAIRFMAPVQGRFERCLACVVPELGRERHL